MPPLESVSDLSAHLGYWLRFVSNHVSHAFARKLSERDITVAEWVMLRTLYGRNPMPPSRLAEETGMTKGAITKLANRLVSRNLVIRSPDTRDGRAQTLALTSEGTSFVPVLAALADENDAEFFGQLSEDERNSMTRILKALVEKHALKSVPIQ